MKQINEYFLKILINIKATAGNIKVNPYLVERRREKFGQKDAEKEKKQEHREKRDYK